MARIVCTRTAEVSERVSRQVPANTATEGHWPESARTAKAPRSSEEIMAIRISTCGCVGQDAMRRRRVHSAGPCNESNKLLPAQVCQTLCRTLRPRRGSAMSYVAALWGPSAIHVRILACTLIWLPAHACSMDGKPWVGGGQLI